MKLPRRQQEALAGRRASASQRQRHRSVKCNVDLKDLAGTPYNLRLEKEAAEGPQKEGSSRLDDIHPSKKPYINRCVRALSKEGEIAALVLDGTQLVREAQQRHQLAPTAAAALGRLLLGTVLMSLFRKDGETLQITFASDGPLRGMQVIAESSGLVKGKVGNPAADLPMREDGKLDVGGLVGGGTLGVVRTQPRSPQPYTGTVELVSGEVAEDLTQYMAESEQTNSALAVGVKLDGTTGEVLHAGGFLVTVLPDASDNTITDLEHNVTSMPPVSDLLAKGMELEEMVQHLMHGPGLDHMSVLQQFVQYGPCDADGLQARMKRAVAALGEADVRKLLDERGAVEVACHFCNDQYSFGREEMEAFLEAQRPEQEAIAEVQAEADARFDAAAARLQGLSEEERFVEEQRQVLAAMDIAHNVTHNDDVLGSMQFSPAQLRGFGATDEQLATMGWQHGIPREPELEYEHADASPEGTEWERPPFQLSMALAASHPEEREEFAAAAAASAERADAAYAAARARDPLSPHEELLEALAKKRGERPEPGDELVDRDYDPVHHVANYPHKKYKVVDMEEQRRQPLHPRADYNNVWAHIDGIGDVDVAGSRWRWWDPEQGRYVEKPATEEEIRSLVAQVDKNDGVLQPTEADALDEIVEPLGRGSFRPGTTKWRRPFEWDDWMERTPDLRDVGHDRDAQARAIDDPGAPRIAFQYEDDGTPYDPAAVQRRKAPFSGSGGGGDDGAAGAEEFLSSFGTQRSGGSEADDADVDFVGGVTDDDADITGDGSAPHALDDDADLDDVDVELGANTGSSRGRVTDDEGGDGGGGGGGSDVDAWWAQ